MRSNNSSFPQCPQWTKVQEEEESTTYLVLGDESRPDLDLHSDLEDPLEDGPAGDAALQVVYLGAGLVHVEGADDDEVWLGSEVADRDGNLLLDVLAHNLRIHESHVNGMVHELPPKTDLLRCCI